METRISSKGQITLPVEARRKLGIKAGDVLQIKLTEEGVVVFPEKVKSSHDPVKVLTVLQETAGIWTDLKESGSQGTHCF